MEVVRFHLEMAKAFLNDRLAEQEPWKICLGSIGATLVANYVYGQITHKVPWTTRLRKSAFRFVRSLPFVQRKLEEEMQKARGDFEKELLKDSVHLDDIVELPARGVSRESLLALTKTYLGLGEFDWTKGTQSGTVYNGNPELTNLMTEVYGLAAWTNPLHPDTFPGVRKMEAEIVRMACDLFHGDEGSCGTVTTGGTESIILACKAYRNYARDERGIHDPVIVVPVTAHAAFDKAGDLLDVTVRHVPVDPVTQRVDLVALERAICRRTCLIVGSAPQYAHGSMDDIESIAKLGLKYKIPVHVDACLGGFLICFMREAGYQVKPFDFSVPGVTSISADTHKYGYAPKGSSVILYSKPVYRHHQFFSVVDWPGGLYATSNIGGSRAGGIIAACWAAMMYFGRAGYVHCTKKIIDTTRYIAEQLRSVDGIYIIGEPDVSVIAIASREFNIYALSDLMKKKGWNLSSLQFPNSLHLCVTMLHTQPGVADAFINDVRESAKTIKAEPEIHKGGSAAMYGMAQSIPDRGIVDQMTWIYIDAYYATKKISRDGKKKLLNDTK